jgi:predicted transcriptional regulator
VALDLGVYAMLLEHKSPVDSHTVATAVGAEPALIRRILRFLANFGHITEVDVDSFTTNERTAAMTSTKGVNGLILV